jgi:hypothetical protein
VEFNITLPASTKTLDQEIYRADHVEGSLQSRGFEIFLETELRKAVQAGDDDKIAFKLADLSHGGLESQGYGACRVRA